MAINILSIFKPQPKSILFEAAIKSLEGMYDLIKLKAEGEDVSNGVKPEKMFTRVYQHDCKSPALFWIDSNQYIIYYPEFSTPYSYKADDKCKFVQVLRGSLYDENLHISLHVGDTLKVYPHEEYNPHTRDEECYIRVRVEDCHSSFDIIGT